MKSVKLLVTLSVLAASAVCSVESFAAASSSAKLSNLSIELYDLNLSDGIAPSLTWNVASNASSSSYGQVWVQSLVSPYTTDFNIFSGADLATPQSASANVAGTGFASAVYSPSIGSNTLEGSSVTASGNVQNLGSYSAYTYPTNYTGYGNFSLSPFTGALFSASGEVSTAVTGASAAGSESAYADVGIYLAGYNANGSFVAQSYDYLSISAYSSTAGSADSSFNARPMIAYLENNTSESLNVYGQTYAQVSGTTYNTNTAAVPEPETYAMMLAGLGFVGSIAKRKKKTAVTH